jgi:hypothetical protein
VLYISRQGGLLSFTCGGQGERADEYVSKDGPGGAFMIFPKM